MAEPYVFRGNSYRDHAALKHWIMRTRREPALEPDLPILDPHHHHASRRAEEFAAWQKSIRDLATCPNVVVKLGGLGMLIFGFDLHLHDDPPSSEVLAATWKPFIETCIEAFGVNRCMYESNFPVDKQSCDYTACWNAFKRLSAGASAAEKAALFSGAGVSRGDVASLTMPYLQSKWSVTEVHMEPKPPPDDFKIPEYDGLLGLAETQAAWPIEEAIAQGLPRETLRRVAQAISPDPAAATRLVHAVVPKSSLSRRGTLTPAQGEQTERLARLFAYAQRVFGDAEDARAFMHNPHPELRGRRPLDAALTELGGRAVERVLDALAYGLPA